MKYCTQCHHGKAQYVTKPVSTPKGPVNVQGKVILCLNNDYLNPVEQEPMPCIIVREDERFCGFEGRGFREKTQLEVVK